MLVGSHSIIDESEKYYHIYGNTILEEAEVICITCDRHEKDFAQAHFRPQLISAIWNEHFCILVENIPHTKVLYPSDNDWTSGLEESHFIFGWDVVGFCYEFQNLMSKVNVLYDLRDLIQDTIKRKKSHDFLTKEKTLQKCFDVLFTGENTLTVKQQKKELEQYLIEKNIDSFSKDIEKRIKETDDAYLTILKGLYRKYWKARLESLKNSIEKKLEAKRKVIVLLLNQTIFSKKGDSVRIPYLKGKKYVVISSNKLPSPLNMPELWNEKITRRPLKEKSQQEKEQVSLAATGVKDSSKTASKALLHDLTVS